jgi:hypothetical protein
MLMYNEQVIYTAHLQKTATETFEEMASFFDTPKLRKHIKDIKTALGGSRLYSTPGQGSSSWLVQGTEEEASTEICSYLMRLRS